MSWVFVLFMNGWPVDVDRFKSYQECQDKVRMYNAAAKQAKGTFLVWCEYRPQA